jgi:hypothetical protein
MWSIEDRRISALIGSAIMLFVGFVGILYAFLRSDNEIGFWASILFALVAWGGALFSFGWSKYLESLITTCPNCGAKIEIDGQFCKFCGTKIEQKKEFED